MITLETLVKIINKYVMLHVVLNNIRVRYKLCHTSMHCDGITSIFTHVIDMINKTLKEA